MHPGDGHGGGGRAGDGHQLAVAIVHAPRHRPVSAAHRRAAAGSALPRGEGLAARLLPGDGPRRYPGPPPSRFRAPVVRACVVSDRKMERRFHDSAFFLDVDSPLIHFCGRVKTKNANNVVKILISRVKSKVYD